MRTRDIATIALKILGVYVFFQFLMMLPTGLGMLRMGSFMPSWSEIEDGGSPRFALALMAGWFLIVALVYLAFSACAFLGAARLARFFVPDADESVSLIGPVSDQMRTAAFQCLGVYALITWTPDLVQSIVRCTIYGTWNLPRTPFLRRFYDGWSYLISPSVGVVIGLLLVFRARGLVTLVRLARPISPGRMTPKDGGKDPDLAAEG